MTDTSVHISKRKRNIFIIVFLVSLAANFFVLGASISFFMRGHPNTEHEKTSSVERLEKRFLKRINADDRQEVRKIFNQNREKSKALLTSYFKERQNIITYIQGDDIDETQLKNMSEKLLNQERDLSLHLNAVLQELIMTTGPETREQIAKMLSFRDARHRSGRSWLTPKERRHNHPRHNSDE